MKWLYRLESLSPDNGLWYNSKNAYVWGCKNCSGDAKNLPMGYDERYHELFFFKKEFPTS